MMSNRKKFGTMNRGRLVSAPLQVKYNGVLYALPPDEVYIALGYKEIIDQPPTPAEGMGVYFTGYDEDATTITVLYEQRPIEVPVTEPEPYEVSKFYLRIALTKMGLWDQFTQWLSSFDIPVAEGITINGYEAWKEALVLNVNDPMLTPYVEQAKAMFSQYMDEEQMQELIEQCKAK